MQVTQQEYTPRLVRNATILTNGYVAGYVLGLTRTDVNGNLVQDNLDDFNFCALECIFTLGSLTNVTIKVEFSDDNVNWYIPSKTAFTSGIGTGTLGWYILTASGNYYLSLNADFFAGGPLKTKYIRVSSSGVGTVTSSSLQINAVLGTA